jgi:hypothetical protein
MVLAVCAALRVALYVEPEETRMDTTVEVTPASRCRGRQGAQQPSTAGGRGSLPEWIANGGRVHDVLTEAIAEAKREARASGLMDETRR